MIKTIEIDGKEYRMRVSALTPRLYRAFFKRDMIRDMQNLLHAYNQAIMLPEDATEDQKTEANIVVLDYLEVFELATAQKNGSTRSTGCSPFMRQCRRSSICGRKTRKRHQSQKTRKGHGKRNDRRFIYAQMRRAELIG